MIYEKVSERLKTVTKFVFQLVAGFSPRSNLLRTLTPIDKDHVNFCGQPAL